MLTDKQIKEKFRKDASQNPEKHYPFETLKDFGFYRNQCKKCKKFFWAPEKDRQNCGDSSCEGGLSFINNTPAKEKITYLETWKRFSNFFEKKGYLNVNRKPVVARWRDDAYWVGASIYGFQPYVVSGEVEPPSNAVIIPQLSLRFNDVDNVGITGSHYVCFNMLGQLHFEKKENYDVPRYLKEYVEWIVEGMGVPLNELVLHEDVWAGGGTFGPCIEFFSRGLEIGNQVYMQYKALDEGYEELDIKVLDMGQGHERVPWFTSGNSTSYETTFPTVMEYLYNVTGFKPDHEIMEKFLPYCALLNVDEVEDINKVWEDISKKTGVELSKLKETVLSSAALFSIAEHSRAALVALNDGAIPSNVGGGYNLRLVIRRMLSQAEKYDWDIDHYELMKKHAEYLKPIYPELGEHLDESYKILLNEIKKYEANKERSKNTISNLMDKVDSSSADDLSMIIEEDLLIDLYDSKGISPEMVKEEVEKRGKKLHIPDDFYAKVAEKHEKREAETQTKKEKRYDVRGLAETDILYFEDYEFLEFEAKVQKIIDNELVVLDRTAFYPTSGGQLHDIGMIGNNAVVNVFKQEGVILHFVPECTLKEGDIVECKVDWERRKQLSQHHTATHVINAACQKLLGRHCWQAGASKSLEKARLDVTHYETLTEEELKKLEEFSNNLIEKNMIVEKLMLKRNEAEDRFGMRIYQGGFVPGKTLRIIKIGSYDVEACGGTHLNYTGELKKIRILKSSKVQDGVIRIEYSAGDAADKKEELQEDIMNQLVELLSCETDQIPGRCEELFQKWKKAKKALKKGKSPSSFSDDDLRLVSDKRSEGDVIGEGAEILRTQKQHLLKTATKFIKEIEEMREKIKEQDDAKDGVK